MEDRLISVDRLKQSYQHLDEEDYYRKVFDKLIDQQPSVDPMAKGQWMRYDLIVATIRGMSAQHADEGDGPGARALEELAQYFDQISCMVGGE